MSRGVFGGALVSVVAAACIVIGVRAEQPSAAGESTYVVQLTGPVLESWKAAIAAEGAVIQEYVPRFAFRVRMSPPVAARVRQLDFVASVTPVRAADRLARGVIRNGRRLYVARLEPGADAQAVQAALAAAGVPVRQSGRLLVIVADGAQVDFVSNVDGIATVENYAPRIRHNEYGGGVIVGGAAANANGYDGSTQTIAVADTGLGNGTAAGAHAGIAANRILSIFNWAGAPDFCFDVVSNDGAVDVDSGHGTHVSTAALGAGDAAGVGRGTAPAASLVFQAIENYAVPSLLCSLLYGLPEGYYLVGLPDDIGDLFNQGYQQGARVHSNSWGAEVAGSYTADSANADAFVWSHRDMAVAFSAGNSGTDADGDGVVDEVSINAPGTAKNVITVGASENDRQSHWECDTALTYTSCNAQGGQNAIFTYGSAWPERFSVNPLRDDVSAGNAEQLAAFSSRGPTIDGRIKPDVVAPGTWTLSGYASLYQEQYDGAPNPVNGLYQYDGWGFPYDASYKYMGGTSMAAPLVAGGAAVVRDYYQKSRAHQASAALVKAALINSAVDLLDENNDGAFDNANPIPNPHEGWGRVDLAAATDGTEWFVDETAPLVTAATATYTFDVTSPGVPLKATLVWTDYPAIASAEVALVNDLDLTVIAPDGTTYVGNAFDGGWSIVGGAPDRVNNVENVYVFAAAAGTWTVHVSGYNVPNGPQPFALVLDVPLTNGSALPMVRVTVDDSAATEVGPTGGTIRFTRSGDPASALEVAYAVSGTATSGVDFVALTGSMTIPEGTVDVTVPIEALDDPWYEPLETVIVTAVPTAAYTVSSPSSGIVNITSEDQAPDLVVSAFTTPASAQAGASVTVTDTTRNQGLGNAAESETGFYLSTNTTWDVTDVYLGTRPVVALDPGATEAVSTPLTIPADTAAASYYIIAKADWAGAVAESQETNNTRAGVSFKVGPDLLVSAFSAPATAAAGESLQVSDTTKNQGAANAAESVTAFYLSSNTSLDAADQPLGTRTVGALDPGTTSVASTTLTLPAGLASGVYYLLAQADSGGAVAEYLETNNVRASQQVRVGADLTVSALAAPVAVAAGQVIDVNETTANGGGAESPASTTRYYFSVNATLDAGDTLLGSRDVPALDAGASHATSVQLTIPAGAATGAYYLFANADDLAEVAETLETNNNRKFKVNVGPDLVVYDVDGPVAVAPGATMSVVESTKNLGGGPSTATATAFYLSSNASFDTADVLLGSRPVAALAANEVSTATVDLTVPASTANGNYYVIAKADYAGALTEVLETNNVRSSALLRVGPDLVVPTLVAPSTVVRGVAFTVSDTTRNDGSPVGPTTTTYYLSLNTTLDASDLLLGSRAVGALGTSVSENGQASVVVPAGQATGNYYVIAKADGPNAVGEASETNNNKTRSIKVNP